MTICFLCAEKIYYFVHFCLCVQTHVVTCSAIKIPSYTSKWTWKIEQEKESNFLLNYSQPKFNIHSLQINERNKWILQTVTWTDKIMKVNHSSTFSFPFPYTNRGIEKKLLTNSTVVFVKSKQLTKEMVEKEKRINFFHEIMAYWIILNIIK